MCSFISKYHVTSIKDVAPQDFITAFSAHLKTQGKIEIPKWAEYIKTSVHKELSPYDEDFMYVRAAALLRKVYLHPGVGLGALRNAFGGLYRRGSRRSHHQDGAGKINRFLLQELEKIGLVAKEGTGRTLTRQGRQECDNIAVQVSKKEA